MIRFRVFLFSLMLLTTSSAFSNEQVVNDQTTEEEFKIFTETVEKFNQNCLDKDGNFKPDVYVGDYLDYCVTEAKYIENFYNHLGQYIDENPEAYEGYLTCLEQKEERKLSDFIVDVNKASQEMSCTEKDKQEIAQSCSEEFTCNMYRAMNNVVAPLKDTWGLSRISKSVNNYTRSTAEEKKYNVSKCLDPNEGNCVTEVLTAFAGSIVNTGESLWALAKAGASSVMNLGSFFSGKADDALAAANERVDSINSFKTNPAGWFMDKLNGFKHAVNTFVKGSVFCQQWEGKPHLSKCLKPLEKYDCLDCNDGVNAFCAATGALVAEAGMVFFTGGVGNIAAMTARMGSKAVAQLSLKVATKVKAVSPGMRVPAGKTVSRLAASGKINAKTARVLTIANASKTLAMAPVLKAISAIKAVGAGGAQVASYVARTKVGQATKATTERIGRYRDKVDELMDLGTTQISVLARAERAGVNLSNRILGRGRTRQHFKTGRLGRAGGKGATVARKYNKAAERFQSSSNRGQTRPSSEYSSRNDRDRLENRPERRNEEIDRTTANENRNSTPERNDPRDGSRGENRETAANRDNSNRNNDGRREEDGNDSKRNGGNLGRSAAAVAAVQAAGAAANMSEREVNEELAQISKQHENGAFENFAPGQESMEGAMDTLGMKPGTQPGSKEYFEQAQKMQEFYNGTNRHSIVESIKGNNPNMSYQEANDAYEKRRSKVNTALDYMNRNRPASSAISQRENLRDDIATQRDELQKQIAEIRAKRKARATATPQAAIATPYATQGPFSGGQVAGSSQSGGQRAPTAVSRGAQSAATGGGSQPASNNGSGSSNFASDDFSSEVSDNNASNEEFVGPQPEGVVAEEEGEPEAESDAGTEDSEEKEPTRTSSQLASILNGIGERKAEVVKEAKIEWNSNDIAVIDESGTKERRRLEQFRRQFPTVKGEREIYRGSAVNIETYKFPGAEPFNFRVSNNSVFIITAEDAELLKGALE